MQRKKVASKRRGRPRGFVRRGPVVIVLLCGGDKRTQNADIKRAKRMARELE